MDSDSSIQKLVFESHFSKAMSPTVRKKVVLVFKSLQRRFLTMKFYWYKHTSGPWNSYQLCDGGALINLKTLNRDPSQQTQWDSKNQFLATTWISEFPHCYNGSCKSYNIRGHDESTV